MSTVADLFHWLGATSDLAVSDLRPDGFTVASATAPHPRPVRVTLDDERLADIQPLLSLQARDSRLLRRHAFAGVTSGTADAEHDAFAMLGAYLEETLSALPSQVFGLAVTREGSLQLRG